MDVVQAINDSKSIERMIIGLRPIRAANGPSDATLNEGTGNVVEVEMVSEGAAGF